MCARRFLGRRPTTITQHLGDGDTRTLTLGYVFFVRARTMADEYRSLLVGNTPGHGWLDAMERLACASDVGEWCMYCEPNNEIAVIGFRHKRASARYAAAMRQFRAEPIDLAIKEPLSYGFSQVATSPEWRDQFLREYAAALSD